METTPPSESLQRALWFLGAAVVSVSAAVLILWQICVQYEAAIADARSDDTVAVVVAKRHLLPGVPITAEDLYLLHMQPRKLPEGVFLDPEHVIGRIPRERLLHNELVRAERLSDPESGEGLNAVIPRGMRAISLDIEDGQAVSGLLQPGSYVDVLNTRAYTYRGPPPETHTVLQGVFVLAVNEHIKGAELMGREARGLQSPSVTLLVHAHQAEQLAHGLNTGRLHLTLRNGSDSHYAELYGIDVDSLRRKLSKPTPARTARRPAPEQPEYHQVRMIRGDEVRDMRVSLDGNIN